LRDALIIFYQHGGPNANRASIIQNPEKDADEAVSMSVWLEGRCHKYRVEEDGERLDWKKEKGWILLGENFQTDLLGVTVSEALPLALAAGRVHSVLWKCVVTSGGTVERLNATVLLIQLTQFPNCRTVARISIARLARTLPSTTTDFHCDSVARCLDCCGISRLAGQFTQHTLAGRVGPGRPTRTGS
jgi:hypothetical protein